MELTAERFPLFLDEWLLHPIYGHQRFLLHEGAFKKLKVHVPTAGGKTLGALLFALRETFLRPETPVRAIFTYPTNLLSRDQFEHSIVRGLTEWVGARLEGVGAISPLERRFLSQSNLSFEDSLGCGVPTYLFKLPSRLGGRDLYVSVITGEGLQRLFSEENIVELGRRKGTYLLGILDVLNQHDHIILSSPDLLGYVAQRCYSVTRNFYNARWRDELELKLADHQVVIDEYHFYDPYTYLNILYSLEKLASNQLLCLSATARSGYFPDADVLDPSSAFDSSGGTKVGDRVASYPIEVLLHQEEIRVPELAPPDQVIYFFHSVITAHETAMTLAARGIGLTEWTGIRKAVVGGAKLAVATSAAEVGLDLPFRVVHTEFWGNGWEVPSVIQRIGRVGRSLEAGKSQAHIWVTGREPGLLFELFNGKVEMSKTDFGGLLAAAFGEQTFRPEDYVSFYLWDEARVRELRSFWQTPAEVRRLKFHFRPPNSQAVFDWAGTRFVYDWVPIANRYELEKMKEVTDLPFWNEMGYQEWRIREPLGRRLSLHRYEGRKDKEHRRLFW